MASSLQTSIGVSEENSVSARVFARDRDQSISALKALAIVGVVLHHTHNRRLDPVAGAWISALIQQFSWCVLMFLAASGWLHASSEMRERRSTPAFISSRARRLLVPFAALVAAYAAIWQVIQSSSVIRLRGTIPEGFFDKVAVSLWPSGDGTVAEQLYYLPLLFMISVVVHVTWRGAGRQGLMLIVALAGAIGLTAFPRSPITGFSWSVAAWGTFAYATGFVLYAHRDKPSMPIVGVVGGTVAVALLGVAGIPRAMPVMLLAFARPLRLSALPWMAALGEASGTIFAYHTPFVIQPLMIAVSRLTDWRMQIAGAIAASIVSIVATFYVYQALKNTAMKVLLL